MRIRLPLLGKCVGILKVVLGIGHSSVNMILCSAPQRFFLGIVTGRLPLKPFRIGSSSSLLREALQVIQSILATYPRVREYLSCHQGFSIIPGPSQRSAIMGGHQNPHRYD